MSSKRVRSITNDDGVETRQSKNDGILDSIKTQLDTLVSTINTLSETQNTFIQESATEHTARDTAIQTQIQVAIREIQLSLLELKEIQKTQAAILEHSAKTTTLVREVEVLKALIRDVLASSQEDAKELNKIEKSKLHQETKKKYHSIKFVGKDEAGLIVKDSKAVPDEKLRAAITYVLEKFRNYRANDNQKIKANARTLLPEDGLLNYFKGDANEKKIDQDRLCSVLYKGVKPTDHDREWVDTLLCRYVVLSSQKIAFKDQGVDVVELLRKKPYWRKHLRDELRKEDPEVGSDSEAESEGEHD